MEKIETLKNRVAELEKEHVKRRRVERKLQKISKDLTERVKELDCLYSISKLRDKPGISPEQSLQGIVDLIPSAWQYPEITCARLIISSMEFKTVNFKKTKWKLFCHVVVNGQEQGILEVYYLSKKPEADIGPFLKEEEKLLEAIGERIEKIISRQREEEKLQQQQEQMIQMDKMIALGTLVSGVAHEINNPNNFIMLNTPLLKEAWENIIPILDEYYQENGDFLVGGLPYTEMRENIPSLFSGILGGSHRIKSIVKSLKGFAREESQELNQSVDLNAVVGSALTLLNNMIKKSTVKFTCEYGQNIPKIKGNFQRLEQVVINLLQNACEAIPDKHKGIYLTTTYDRETSRVVLKLKDEGIGIPADKLPKISDPFYTTKRDLGGSGLGLSISSGIVKNHNGTIQFHSEPGAGTTVTVILPAIENNMTQTKTSNGIAS